MKQIIISVFAIIMSGITCYEVRGYQDSSIVVNMVRSSLNINNHYIDCYNQDSCVFYNRQTGLLISIQEQILK